MEKRDISINPFKIMIVDDDPMVVKTLERMLYRRNYLFFSVNSGEEALASIADIEPDIILLDVMMSGMSGFEVCAQLKARGITLRIPVIFLTGNNHSTEIIKGFQAGAVDYIVKPFNTEELLARLRTHLELKKSREELKLMTMIKERFFSIMTHDILDSLTGVKGVADFLQQELKQPAPSIEELKKLSSLLLDDSTRLYQFVENLIRWDHIERHSKPVIAGDINIRVLAEDVIKQFDNRLLKKELLMQNFIDADVIVRTDRAMLGSILKELISNAIKYSRQGQQITLALAREGKTNTITVADQGVGIDKDVADNIFRLDTPHPKTIGTANEKGIGLGLIICSTLINKLKGEIKIISEKYNGATFAVTFPDLD